MKNNGTTIDFYNSLNVSSVKILPFKMKYWSRYSFPIKGNHFPSGLYKTKAFVGVSKHKAIITPISLTNYSS